MACRRSMHLDAASFRKISLNPRRAVNAFPKAGIFGVFIIPWGFDLQFQFLDVLITMGHGMLTINISGMLITPWHFNLQFQFKYRLVPRLALTLPLLFIL